MSAALFLLRSLNLMMQVLDVFFSIPLKSTHAKNKEYNLETDVTRIRTDRSESGKDLLFYVDQERILQKGKIFQRIEKSSCFSLEYGKLKRIQLTYFYMKNTNTDNEANPDEFQEVMGKKEILSK